MVQASEISLLGVFDGHGPSGHIIADYVEEQLPKRILKLHEQPNVEVTAEMPGLFTGMQGSLLANPHLGSDLSGTTATVILHDSELHTLTLAHVGDSRAVMLTSVS